MGPGLGLEVGQHDLLRHAARRSSRTGTRTTRGREAAPGADPRRATSTASTPSATSPLTRRARRPAPSTSSTGTAAASQSGSTTPWPPRTSAPTSCGAAATSPGRPPTTPTSRCGHGVRYVWRGRVTSVTGQDVPRRLGGIFDPGTRSASARTLAKEAVKGPGWAAWASRSTRCTRPTGCFAPARLRDGQPVFEFLRANPYWQAVDEGETADGLAESPAPPRFSTARRRGGLMVLYTHLGKVSDRRVPFGPATRAALGRLAEAYRAGRVLVTTTRRLLDYAPRPRRGARGTYRSDGDLRRDRRPDARRRVRGSRSPSATRSGSRVVVDGKPCQRAGSRRSTRTGPRYALRALASAGVPTPVTKPRARPHAVAGPPRRAADHRRSRRRSSRSRRSAGPRRPGGTSPSAAAHRDVPLRGLARPPTSRRSPRRRLCGRVVVVANDPVPRSPRSSGSGPPALLVRAARATAGSSRRLFAWRVAPRRGPTSWAASTCCSTASLAIAVARLAGARSLFFCVGGTAEVDEGGRHGENRLFGLMPGPDPVVERRLLRAVERAATSW